MSARNAAEALPLRIEVACPECGRSVSTTQSGNTTRCPEDDGGCGTPFRIPPGFTRPPVTLACNRCGHLWSTRAAGGGTVRCPSCQHNRRVPVSIRDGAEPPRRAPRTAPARRPAASRRAPEPEPEPESASLASILGSLFGNRGSVPAPRPASQARTAPKTPKAPGRPVACRKCWHQWSTTAAPGNTVRCPECGYAQRLALPSTSRPTYTVQHASAQAAAQAAQLRTPDRPDRTEQVATLVRSFGGPFEVVSSAHLLGICEVLDTRRPNPADQRCASKTTRAVVFDTSHVGGPELHAYTCAVHAEQLLTEAASAFHVRAEIVTLPR